MHRKKRKMILFFPFPAWQKCTRGIFSRSQTPVFLSPAPSRTATLPCCRTIGFYRRFPPSSLASFKGRLKTVAWAPSAFLACWCHLSSIGTRALWEQVPGWVLSCQSCLEMLTQAWDENVSLPVDLLCSPPTPAREVAAAVAKQPVYSALLVSRYRSSPATPAGEFQLGDTQGLDLNSAAAHHLWPSPLCWGAHLPRGVLPFEAKGLPFETRKKSSRSLTWS